MFLAAVTGDGRHENPQRALAAGFDQHLTKLVTMQDVIEQACRVAGARIEARRCSTVARLAGSAGNPSLNCNNEGLRCQSL